MLAEIEPFLRVAQQLMAHKGLPQARPDRTEGAEGAFLWSLDSDLTDGHLVLEVSWTQKQGWVAFVWDFQPLPLGGVVEDVVQAC